MVNHNDDEQIPKLAAEEEADLQFDGNTAGARIINKRTAPLVENQFKVLLELKGVAESGEGRLGVDLVTILDISGSMNKESRLSKMKLAMQFLLQKLGRTDRLSVVTFNYEANRLCPMRLITENSRAEIADKVNALEAEYTTNTEDGLRLALKILEDRTLTKGRRAAIMLMSDGQEDKNSNASNVPVGRVPVYTFSFGADDFDPKVFSDIASNSYGGMYTPVPDLDDLNVSFSASLAGLLSVAIDGLTLTIIPAKGSSKFTEINAGNYKQTGNIEDEPVTVTFGSLYDQETRKVLVVLTLPEVKGRLGANILAMEYKYRVGVNDTSKFDQRTINITRTDASTMVEDEEVLAEEKRINTAKSITAARLLADKKELEKARETLNDAKTSLSEVDAILTAQLDKLLEFMVSQDTYDKQGRAYALALEAAHASQRPNPSAAGMFNTPLIDLFVEQAQLFDKQPTNYKVPTAEKDKRNITIKRIERTLALLEQIRMRYEPFP